MELNIFSTPEEVTRNLAKRITAIANEAVDNDGSFSIALSGGNSPKQLYELLASPPLAEEFPWEDTFFFFGDERYVPADHPDNNALMARQAMLQKRNVDEHNILAIDTRLSPADAARDYEKQIREHFGTDAPKLDLILLGLGDDAHTASLFPHTKVLDENQALVKEVHLLDKDVWRITMTRKLINDAHKIIFFTFGSKKAEAVKQVLEGEEYAYKYPSQLIRPVDGQLSWFMDEAAASLLTHSK